MCLSLNKWIKIPKIRITFVSCFIRWASSVLLGENDNSYNYMQIDLLPADWGLVVLDSNWLIEMRLNHLSGKISCIEMSSPLNTVEYIFS